MPSTPLARDQTRALSAEARARTFFFDIITTTEWAATAGPRAMPRRPTPPRGGSNTREANSGGQGWKEIYRDFFGSKWPCMSDALAGADGSFFSRLLAGVLLGSQETAPSTTLLCQQVNHLKNRLFHCGS